MKRDRPDSTDDREVILETQRLESILQTLVLKWNVFSNHDRGDLTMYHGIVKFSQGNHCQLLKYIHELEEALNLSETPRSNPNPLKHRIL